jgi:transcriptional/translational regulatory protein YebC/TACO1
VKIGSRREGAKGKTSQRVRYASLINFPGPDGTVTLLDVLTDNKKRLSKALE